VAIAAVEELGRAIERAWQRVDYEIAAFPALCAEKLQAARLHERVSPDEVVRSVFAAELPAQKDPRARFGQPPVTLFRARSFYVDALFWVDGTTTIHDHAFSGAFQVMSGESIETNFQFASSRMIGEHLRFGSLDVRGSSLRRTGDVSAIPAGPGYIHSLFHLARPTVSLVARTYHDVDPGVQFEYSPAGIAFDAIWDEPMRERAVQIVDMLRKTNHPCFEDMVGELITSSDLHTALAIVRACVRLPDTNLVERLTARIRDREASDRVRDWSVWRRRIELLMARRAVIHDPSLRFLLAVLLNAQRRTDALALVAGYSNSRDPGQQIAAWLRDLSSTTIKLQVGSTPFEPNVLGLPLFGPGCEEALASLLNGRNGTHTRDVQMFVDRLRALPYLRVLFSDVEVFR
jgi:hypothetical protein